MQSSPTSHSNPGRQHGYQKIQHRNLTWSGALKLIPMSPIVFAVDFRKEQRGPVEDQFPILRIAKGLARR
jgi:hypothetical protein